MTNSYTTVGDDLYAFVEAIDITGLYEDGWAHTFNRPFEPDEVTTGGYPTLMVVPAEDEASTLDSATDSDRIVYWVVLYESIQNTLINGEGTIRALADLVRNALRAERVNPSPLGNDSYDMQLAGTWGWDSERAERFYRLVVTITVAQDLE